jgi:TctA family transporter
MYGGSTTSILVNIPGEASSVPTAMEGYQLNLQGRGGPALRISALASFAASTMGIIGLTFFAPALHMGAHKAYLFGRTLVTYDVAVFSDLGIGILSKCRLRAADPATIIEGWVAAL